MSTFKFIYTNISAFYIVAVTISFVAVTVSAAMVGTNLGNIGANENKITTLERFEVI